MFLRLLIMSKRLRFFISSVIGVVSFYFYLALPVESSYYGLLLLLGTVIFIFWFGLGIIFEGSVETKIMTVLLPSIWTLGFGLFATLIPANTFYTIILSLFFGIILYIMFLVKNVFLVAIGFRTVPLYRAAYTVSVMLTLLASFFLFDSMLSFKLPFWANMLITFIFGIVIFANHYWNVAIELPDDGKEKGRWPYIIVPSVILAELSVVLSFWPVGIFKGSVYLVSAIYVISGLIQAEIRDRLFKGVVLNFIYIGLAAILAAILTTNWG